MFTNFSAEDRREYLESLLRESKKEEAAPVLDDEALNYLLARRYIQQWLNGCLITDSGCSAAMTIVALVDNFVFLIW